jgi:hypothetical protein
VHETNDTIDKIDKLLSTCTFTNNTVQLNEEDARKLIAIAKAMRTELVNRLVGRDEEVLTRLSTLEKLMGTATNIEERVFWLEHHKIGNGAPTPEAKPIYPESAPGQIMGFCGECPLIDTCYCPVTNNARSNTPECTPRTKWKMAWDMVRKLEMSEGERGAKIRMDERNRLIRLCEVLGATQIAAAVRDLPEPK